MYGLYLLVQKQKSLIELYTDVLNLLTEFDAKLSRKDGKFVNTLPQVYTYMYMYIYMYVMSKCM